MTLYWWMHWFWITTLKLQVLVSLFSWCPLVYAASLPLGPTVQNGHQNGPYFNDLAKEHGVTTVPSQLSTNSEQGSQYLVKDQTTTKLDITKDLTPPQLAHVHSQVFTPDYEGTDFPSDNESQSEDIKKSTLTDNVEKQGKNTAIPSLGTPTSSSVGKFLFSSTNGNDGSAQTLPHIGPLIERPHPKGEEDSKIIWIDKLSPKVLGFHDKHTKLEQVGVKVGEDTILEEVPMSDGPYNPTGSFINSTNIRVKAVSSTSKPPEITTGKDAQLISKNEKTEDERKDKLLVDITSTEGTGSFLVTDDSENINNMDHATENVNGSNNLSVNSTDSALDDDINSTLVMGGNATYGDNADTSSIEMQHKNKSRQENIISVVSFDHSNIEESTKVSSGIVQSVIDESVNSRGKTLNAMAITGIVMGVVVGVVLIGSVSCVVYRRRYLNNPQTLNDKCSNPDSSGYIDDSTLRENSEEMYSLDNDSFLNSLEAMTIQNYWTDNVKHTKL